MEIKNAIVESTMLGVEGHGIMTCMVHLDYGGIHQGFGGWALDEPIKDSSGKFVCRKGTAQGMQFIQKLLEALEVDSWEKLKGVHCRVESDHCKVYRIGHILKDQWFDPKEIGYR